MDNTPLSNTTNGWQAPNGGGVIRRTQTGSRLRRFVFTLPNWTQEEYEKIIAIDCRWMIVGKEISPETGTPHLQGACILGTQMSFSRIKTLIGSRAHIEPMAGKPVDSQRYCRKEDLNAFEKGTLPSEGKRTDLHAVTARVLGGESINDLAKDPDMGAVAVVKFHRGLTVLRSLTSPPRVGPPKVTWLFGPTGSGKTRCAFDAAKALSGSDNDVWISSGNLRWFDGYDGQSSAIFDDFRAKDVKFNYFLRLLDRYPMSVEFKGGHVNWNPTYIFITCPSPPDECFALRSVHKPEDIKQLERRITMVCNFRESDGDNLWDKFSAAIISTYRRDNSQGPPESDGLGAKLAEPEVGRVGDGDPGDDASLDLGDLDSE